MGAKKDPTDHRDLKHRVRYAAAIPPLLPAAARVRYSPPIKQQGYRKSCTGHAVAWFWEQVLHSRMGRTLTLSPAFPWYYARKEEGVEKEDEGVSMRSIMDAIHDHGVCPNEMWDTSMPVDAEPPSMARTYGQALKLPRYERCDDLDTIRYAIAKEDQSVCIGVPVFANWYNNPRVSRTGVIPMPGDSEEMGGHAMVICGYDDRKQILTVANSWGTQFGDHGFVYLPYQFLEQYWFDGWTVGFDAIPDQRV